VSAVDAVDMMNRVRPTCRSTCTRPSRRSCSTNRVGWSRCSAWCCSTAPSVPGQVASADGASDMRTPIGTYGTALRARLPCWIGGAARRPSVLRHRGGVQ
jgi:hypothetical protein